AAIEILRSAEAPLHFKEIARLAVERKLLSHVGRDPEGAMQTCLNQAVRSNVHDGAVQRSKPGFYMVRPGAALPATAAPASARRLPDADEPQKKKISSNSSKKAAKPSTSKEEETEEAAEVQEQPARKKRTRRRKKSSRERAEVEADEQTEETEESPDEGAGETEGSGEGPGGADEDVADADEAEADEAEADEVDEEPSPLERLGSHVPPPPPGLEGEGILPMPALDTGKVRFRGPEGSGLEEDTDIALVMANAMSRLVDERPELREELEAMQKGQAPVPEIIEVGRRKRREEERDDERSGRRRRRRRRKGRRVEWSEGGTSVEARGQELLDKVAEVLVESAGRSLHVRQIAENLAGQNVLGGEISEIERAVTAAILLDVHARGEGSRFAVRGDARYQLRGSRLPEKAAAAEHTARRALHDLERETEEQLLLWLQSLGARSLESLVRIWLDREGFSLAATLPPARGLGKLIADDPEVDEDDARTLVLIIPRKTAPDPRLWEGEAERNNCAATLVFTMGDRSMAMGDAAELMDSG
ncbi:MAG: winged helix-turn-helix domain-containing protein, partial [Myxococcales bacterium]|nr:winged helix-turn-helix domain-containing protein [Myxococcales bacterium]